MPPVLPPLLLSLLAALLAQLPASSALGFDSPSRVEVSEHWLEAVHGGFHGSGGRSEVQMAVFRLVFDGPVEVVIGPAAPHAAKDVLDDPSYYPEEDEAAALLHAGAGNETSSPWRAPQLSDHAGVLEVECPGGKTYRMPDEAGWSRLLGGARAESRVLDVDGVPEHAAPLAALDAAAHPFGLLREMLPRSWTDGSDRRAYGVAVVVAAEGVQPAVEEAASPHRARADVMGGAGDPARCAVRLLGRGLASAASGRPLPAGAAPAPVAVDAPERRRHRSSALLERARRAYGGRLSRMRSELGMRPRPVVALQTREQSAARALLGAKIDGAVKGAVESVSGPAVEVMSGGMTEILDSNLGATLGQTSESSVADELVQKLVPEIAKGVDGIIPAMGEALSAQLEERVTHDMATAVVGPVGDDVSQRLRPGLQASVTSQVTAAADSSGSAETALGAVKPLSYTLSKMLTHSIVPALVQTLHHSASQDYICYECYHHQTWCDKCHYAPVQVMYGSWYAGFFSTWYTPYYADYYYEYFKSIVRPDYDDGLPRSSDDNSDSVEAAGVER